MKEYIQAALPCQSWPSQGVEPCTGSHLTPDQQPNTWSPCSEQPVRNNKQDVSFLCCCSRWSSKLSVSLSPDLWGAVRVALEVSALTPVMFDGAQDGGDVDDSCSVNPHPCRPSCSRLQQRQEGLDINETSHQDSSRFTSNSARNSNESRHTTVKQGQNYSHQASIL